MNIDAKAREVTAKLAVGCGFDVCPYDPCTCRSLIAAALLAVRNETLEEAAKLAQDLADSDSMDATRIATAIRALKDTTG